MTRNKKTVYFKKDRGSRKAIDKASSASLIILGYCKALQTTLLVRFSF